MEMKSRVINISSFEQDHRSSRRHVFARGTRVEPRDDGSVSLGEEFDLVRIRSTFRGLIDGTKHRHAGKWLNTSIRGSWGGEMAPGDRPDHPAGDCRGEHLSVHRSALPRCFPRSSSKPDSENSFVRSCLPGIETRSCLVDISSFFLFILFFFSFVRFALFRSRFTIIRYNFTFEAREIDSRDRHFMT